MKELSIEEKASRYDEAIEKAKEMIKAMTNIGGVAKVDDIQYLFPELSESEDERIRKTLIGWVNIEPKESFENGFSKEEILTWLEKQGKNNMGISEATKKKLEDNLNKALEKETPESWNKFLDEQKSAWSEEDSNMLQSILDEYKSMAIEKRNWLKSLRPQHHWKPSKEQIKALTRALSLAKNCGEESAFDLRTLYEQLKKL